jgi:3-oxoacyl-[acyl-carrier-protein] synthase III
VLENVRAQLSGVSYYTPERQLTNALLTAEFPDWSVDKIAAKTGIRSRAISREDEFSSHMATKAASALFEEMSIDPGIIDYLILCTQTPDFLLPSTACVVQEQLGVPSSAGAIDVNQGCSGYIYSLGLAKGLVETRQSRNVLVLTADTYSKLLNPLDRSVRTIFGDAASATLVSVAPSGDERLSGFTYGTDGSGAQHLITANGNLRDPISVSPKAQVTSRGLTASSHDLYMNGPEIFNFTLRVVPPLITEVLETANLTLEDISYFVPHQANAFMLHHLREKLEIPEEKFVIEMDDVGNTVSSTIPIALAKMQRTGHLSNGMRILVFGFGVGLSWAGAVVTWSASNKKMNTGYLLSKHN